MNLIKPNNSVLGLKNLHLNWGQYKYKGQTYRSYSLARSYREDGKNKKETVIKLGKLSDEEVARWKNVLKASRGKGPIVNLDDVVCTSHIDYLDVMVVLHYWEKWQLAECFPGKGRRVVDVADVAKILTVNRCLDPMSKSVVPRWFKHTVLPHKLSIKAERINATRIFRALETIEDNKENICSHIINRVQRNYPDSVKAIFFDLSTTRFSGTKSPLVKWGRSKDGYDYHAVLALLVSEQGLPLYWEVLKGGTHDTHTLSWLVKKVSNRFNLGQITLVFDRGMVSDKNLKFLEEENRKYITALDKNQVATTSEYNFSLVDKLGTTEINAQVSKILKPLERFDDNTFIMEDFIGEEDRRYILIFNSEMFEENQKLRAKKIEEYCEFVKKINKVMQSATNSRARKTNENIFNSELKKKGLSELLTVNLEIKYLREQVHGQTARTRIFEGTVNVNNNAIKIASRIDGFWMLVTNHTALDKNEKFRMEAKNVLKAYRDKHIVESSFRDIKSFVEVAPVHVWKEKHVKAHYTICVIAHLINRCVALDLAKNRGKKSKEIISAQSLYRELSRCKLNQLKSSSADKTSWSVSKVSPVIKDLLKRLDVENLISNKIPIISED